MLILSITKIAKVLNFIRISKLSGVLLIRCKGSGGGLEFREGQLTFAQVGNGKENLNSDAALRDLLGWEEAEMKWQSGNTSIALESMPLQAEVFFEAVEQMVDWGYFEPYREAEKEIPQFFGLPTDYKKIPSLKNTNPENNSNPIDKAKIYEGQEVNFLQELPYGVSDKKTTPSPIPPDIILTETKEGEVTPPAFSNPPGTKVSILDRLKLPHLTGSKQFLLNSYFANTLTAAKEVAGVEWPQVAEAAQLLEFLQTLPPYNSEYTIPVEYPSQLNYGFEQVFGSLAKDKLNRLGSLAAERAFFISESSRKEQNLILLIPSKARRLAAILNNYTRKADEIRGEHLYEWKQVDKHQFWLVQYRNLYALGRRRRKNSCFVWVASIETMLAWAGLEQDCLVEEIECGCTNGTFDCVFALSITRP